MKAVKVRLIFSDIEAWMLDLPHDSLGAKVFVQASNRQYIVGGSYEVLDPTLVELDRILNREQKL